MIFKNILDGSARAVTDQPTTSSLDLARSELRRPSMPYTVPSDSSSESASLGGLSGFTTSTASPTSDVRAYSNSNTIPLQNPSFSHLQPTFDGQFQLAGHIGAEHSTNLVPPKWNPLGALAVDPSTDASLDYIAPATNPTTQHYQPFLQGLYCFQAVASRNPL
jgi:hypothetical protein